MSSQILDFRRKKDSAAYGLDCTLFRATFLIQHQASSTVHSILSEIRSSMIRSVAQATSFMQPIAMNLKHKQLNLYSRGLSFPLIAIVMT